MAARVKESGLDYEPLTVGELFGYESYYTVPLYQRGYSWGSEEVRELLKDLTEAHDSFPNEAYLLGQIIVCPSTTPLLSIDREVVQYDLIDGQQRSTTLYLLILTALKMLKTWNSTGRSNAELRKWSTWEMLKSIPDTRDDELLHPRIRVASNGEEFTTRLLLSQPLDNPNGPTQSNISTAVDEIQSHFETMSAEQIRSFLEFTLSHVWLVRLSLASSSHALRVFQKVNNRGLELDDADLIKNFLFQSVSDEDYYSMSEKWETATNTLHGARLKRVKSMEFLMKALIGIKTGASVPTGALYEKWSGLLKTEQDVKSLANQLPESAKKLVRINKGQLPNSGQKTDLTTGTFMAGWIQQFEIQLAGSHLEEDKYARLLKMVEDRAMLSYWAKEPSQKFEVIIHPWAHNVKELGANPSESDLISAGESATKDFEELAERAFLGIRKLTYTTGTHRDRIRYILARINRIVQAKINVTSYGLADLMQTSKGDATGYDLDHIFPKSQGQRQYWKQSQTKNIKLGDEDRYEQSIHSIGNIILLHPDDNREQSDALPWDDEKLSNLANSELYLNRLLTDSGLWPRKNEYLTSLQNKFEANAVNWSEDAIDARAELYWAILLEEIELNLGIAKN